MLTAEEAKMRSEQSVQSSRNEDQRWLADVYPQLLQSYLETAEKAVIAASAKGERRVSLVVTYEDCCRELYIGLRDALRKAGYKIARPKESRVFIEFYW